MLTCSLKDLSLKPSTLMGGPRLESGREDWIGVNIAGAGTVDVDVIDVVVDAVTV